MATREIKFRGKRLDNGEWVYGNLVITEVETFILPFDQLVTSISPEFEDAYKIDPATVGQLTGRIDKNGKEVYEGDIIQFYKGYVDDSWTDSEQGKPYLIQWQIDSLSFKSVRKNNYIIPCAGQEGKYKWKWEVIGNIHDNPELLK